jgi:signal transduction histidine kinase
LLDISFSPRVAAVVTVAIGAVLAVLIIRAHSRPALRMPLSLHGTFAVAAGASLLAAVAIGMPVWTWSAHGERVMVLAMWSFLLGLTVVWHPRSSGAAAQWLGIYLALVTVFAAFNLVFGQNVNSGVGLGEALVLVASAACVVAGSGAEVHRMLRLQDRANSRVAMDFNARVATQEHRAERLEERLHNARSSLAAARAADITLRVHHHDLNEHARDTLATGLTNELSRLEELIRPVDKAVLVSDFRLADVLGPVVAAERSHGADICLSVGDLVAHGRPADLGAVVQNLIVNARLYAPGTPISIAARREEGRVLLAVEDRGPGIPASLRSNLFVRGQRGHTSAGTSGSGLGLFISYGLMLDMGGTIEVDDGPQPGARFVVEMPAGIDEWTM